MKELSRKHHYLPQSYLAAFTNTKTKGGLFYVFDVTNGKHFQTSTKNVAAKRDFNKINIEGMPPDILENKFSTFEEEVAKAIQYININLTFPDDEKFISIINMICLIALRNPRLRSSFNRSRESVIRIVADMLVSSKETYHRHLEKAKSNGYIGETDVSFEEMKKFITDGTYALEFPPEENIRIEFHTFDSVLKLLEQRFWSLLVAPDPGPTFICSDHPVTLVAKPKNEHTLLGYGQSNTVVIFPIGQRTCFYGAFEDKLPRVKGIDPVNVAAINSIILDNAESHIFSTTNIFYLLDRDRIIEAGFTF